MSDTLTGFLSENVALTWRLNKDFLLPEGLPFRWRGHLFRHKPGGHTDFLSSPKFLQAVTDANSDRTWAAREAAAHDGGYHDDIEIFEDGQWKPFPMSKDDSDTMFRDLLEVGAKTEKQKLEAIAFYEAVAKFGQSAFDSDRKEKLSQSPAVSENPPGGMATPTEAEQSAGG